MSVNDELLNAQVRHMVYLQRYSASLYGRILALLARVDDDLSATIRKRLASVIDRGPRTTERLTKLLDDIRLITAKAYAASNRETKAQLKSLSETEVQFQAALLAGTIPAEIGYIVETPQFQRVWSAALAQPFQGRLLREWGATLDETAYRAVRDQIRIGFVEGEGIEQIVRRITGTRANRYQDGILELNRRHVRAVVRTAVNHTASHARQSVFSANSDVIQALKWVATLDSRTTPICRSRDGKTYPVESGPRPPAHIGCRSAMVAVTKSWRQLGIDRDEISAGTRASMNGQVPEELTYGPWLRQQDRAFVEETLGKTKAKLFLNGKLPIDRFVDRAGNELTLEELQGKYPSIFKNAGL